MRPLFTYPRLRKEEMETARAPERDHLRDAAGTCGDTASLSRAEESAVEGRTGLGGEEAESPRNKARTPAAHSVCRARAPRFARRGSE